MSRLDNLENTVRVSAARPPVASLADIEDRDEDSTEVSQREQMAPSRSPVDCDEPPTTGVRERLRVRRGNSKQPWLHPDNPALWSGQVDDD